MEVLVLCNKNQTNVYVRNTEEILSLFKDLYRQNYFLSFYACWVDRELNYCHLEWNRSLKHLMMFRNKTLSTIFYL